VPATLLAHGSERAAVGVLLNVYTRGPATLCMTAAALASIAPRRMHIVLGVASPLLVQRWNGIAYEHPFRRLQGGLRFLRRTLSGERVNGFALAETPVSPPALLVAACGPRALELAATEADGVVLNWLAPSEIDRVEPLPAERSRVSIVVPVCPSPDPAVVDETMRPIVGDYLNAPAYAGQQRRLGRAAALGPMWDAWSRGDRAGAHRLVPRSTIEELVVSGTPADCRRRLDAIEADTGARAIATYFLPAGPDQPGRITTPSFSNAVMLSSS
jgi:alkanesulfonate monooxygenase SsuD/methylene tetrahydromethanopterin reductase-like flavin-dependent oxidoreductase (luciferase family)